MANAIRFPYVHIYPKLGEAGFRPQITLELRNINQNRNQSINSYLPDVDALLDTGSTVNVLPYSFGLALGAIWEQQTQRVQLTGNLANFEARGLILEGIVGSFEPVDLTFAWTRRDHIPLILGQINFFSEFDVCFFRTRRLIEIQPKQQ